MAVNYLNNFNFAAHIQQNLPNGFNQPINNNACPDQLVGRLVNGTFFPYPIRADIDYQARNNNYCINNLISNDRLVVLLESPHVNEYDPITGQALGPALGSTGRYFQNYFSTLLAASRIFVNLNSLTLDVVLANPVQYQCSLGLNLSIPGNATLRDRNLISCFHGGPTSNDLDHRLQALRPSFVINLCTTCLRQYVTTYITNNYPYNYNFTDGNHLQSWRYPNNRIIN